MQAPKNRPLPPRPRPYNPTCNPVAKRLDEWELVSIDDPDILAEEITEIRARNVATDIPPLPPMTEWLDLDLPLPPPRPRPRWRT